MNERSMQQRPIRFGLLMAVVMLAAAAFPGIGAAQVGDGQPEPSALQQVLNDTAEQYAEQNAVPFAVAYNRARIAYYYKPSTNATVAELAEGFGFFILAKGNEAYRDQLIAAGARRPILNHLRAEAIHDPGSCTAMPWQNNVAFKVGDFCDISQNHPDWFLLDQNGQRIVDVEEGQDFYLMDPGNAEWQQFYISRVAEILLDPNWDGIFLDNFEVTLDFREDQGEVPAKYTTDEAYWAAHEAFAKALYETYFVPNNKLLFANIASRKEDANFADYVTYFHGVMFEGWTIDNPNRWRTVERVEKHLNTAEQVQRMGKFIILVGQGAQNDLELQQFAYGNYLLVNEGRAAFRYAFNQNYREAWWYSNYEIDLGAPLGPRYEVAGDEWRRDFENGCLSVNLVTHAVNITTACTQADQATRFWMPFVAAPVNPIWPPFDEGGRGQYP